MGGTFGVDQYRVVTILLPPMTISLSIKATDDIIAHLPSNQLQHFLSRH